LETSLSLKATMKQLSLLVSLLP